jgi:hypothetical protein
MYEIHPIKIIISIVFEHATKLDKILSEIQFKLQSNSANTTSLYYLFSFI